MNHLIIYNELEELLNYIGQYNLLYFPFTIILPLILVAIAFILVILCYHRPSDKLNIYLKIFIITIYIIAGFETFSICLFTRISLFYLSGSIIIWTIAILFFTDLFIKKMDFNFSKIPSKDIKIISLILIIWGTIQ